MPRLILPISEEPSVEAFAAYDAAQALEAEMFDAKAYAESPAEHLSKIHRIAQSRALDAFVEPWRSKLAEQCGKTLAAHMVLREAAAALRVNTLRAAPTLSHEEIDRTSLMQKIMAVLAQGEAP